MKRDRLEVYFSTDKVQAQCTELKSAKKVLGGNERLAICLLSRINALEQAETLTDIVIQQQFHFHKLSNKNGRNLEGFFAICVNSKRDSWRIILQPLDEEGKPFDPCHIDEIANVVEIVQILEVSKHYE